MDKTNLHIVHNSKQSFIDILQYVLNDLCLERVLFSSRDLMPSGPICMLPHVCMDIPLSGLKHMIYSSRNQLHDALMKPGEIHYSPQMSWKQPLWDSPHEMSSIVFNPDFIRITYISLDEPAANIYGQTARMFYHTYNPPSKTCQSILQALNQRAEASSQAATVSLMRALLEITLEELEQDQPGSRSKAHDTWLQICHYLREHYQTPINRAHVASVFELNPSYVSRLFKLQGDESFNTMLRRLRLEHAALLLTNTRMTMDEVTESCGYLSSTFFISAFKRHHGVTPGTYRRTGK